MIESGCRTLILAGLQEARKGGNAKTVVMGYCFGGAAVLELARSGKAEGISGYVSFHGGLATPQGQTYPSSTPPILIAHGGADASVSMEDVAALSKELESAGVPLRNPDLLWSAARLYPFRIGEYQKRADELSWEAFLDFLATNAG